MRNKKSYKQCRKKAPFVLSLFVNRLGFYRKDQDDVREKLRRLEAKVITGGENLLEKAEKQAVLLEQSEQELQKRIHNEEQLRKQLQQKEVTYTSSL